MLLPAFAAATFGWASHTGWGWGSQRHLSVRATSIMDASIEDRLLERLLQLPPDERECHSEASYPGGAASYSPSEIRRAAKQILAASTSVLERQDALAALSEGARVSGRAASALLAYDLGTARVRKWRAANPDTAVSPALVRAGMLAHLALRDQAGYVRAIVTAQDAWGLDLTAQGPVLLSSALGGCCEAGWMQHAAAANISLCDAGLRPLTDALNALMAARLAAADSDGALDVFIEMRSRGPQADRTSQALAVRAAAGRKTSWSGLRNLMRRKWLKIPWNSHTANAALGAFVDAGEMIAALEVAAEMEATRTPLRLDALHALQRRAVSSPAATVQASSHCCAARVYRAIEDHVATLRLLDEDEDEEEEEAAAEAAGGEAAKNGAKNGATNGAKNMAIPLSVAPAARLLRLPELPPPERVPFCLRGVDESPEASPQRLLMRTALAVVYASEGSASECVATLLQLHADGVDFQTIDVHSTLGPLVDSLNARGSSDAGKAHNQATSGDVGASSNDEGASSGDWSRLSLEDLLRGSPVLEASAFMLTDEEKQVEREVREEEALRMDMHMHVHIHTRTRMHIHTRAHAHALATCHVPRGYAHAHAQVREEEEAFQRRRDLALSGGDVGAAAPPRQRRRGRKERNQARHNTSQPVVAGRPGDGLGAGRGSEGGQGARGRGRGGRGEGEAVVRERRRRAARRQRRHRVSLWVHALRACGSSVATAEAIADAMESVEQPGRRRSNLMELALRELLVVSGRAVDPAAALAALRRFDVAPSAAASDASSSASASASAAGGGGGPAGGSGAPASAYVTAALTCCLGGSMDQATSLLGRMRRVRTCMCICTCAYACVHVHAYTHVEWRDLA